MKTNHLFGKFAVLLTIASLVFLTSCKDDVDLISKDDATDASDESLTDAYYEDGDDLAVDYLQHESPAKDGGRAAAFTRICDNTQITKTNASETSGSITIDFGTGCTDAKGNTRKGKINLAYSHGPFTSADFTVVMTFDNYSINDIKLEGTRTITRVPASATGNIKHNISLVGGKATWPDNSSATRTSAFEREFNPAAGTATLSGSATGVGRKGKGYNMTITNTLIYKKTCVEEGIYMAVEGTKTFITDGKTFTINFGDGTCDKKVTVTYKGISKEVTVNRN